MKTINNIPRGRFWTEYPDWDHRAGGGLFHGIPAQQNKNFYDSFKRLFERENIARICEIGTAEGGFIYALRTLTDVPIITYDIHYGQWHNKLTAVNIDVKHISCWDDMDAIIQYIRGDGQTLMCVDGGDKIREFNTFSKYLKSNDIIMAHDYHYNKESETRNSVWKWCEISYPDIRESVEELGLIDECSNFNDCAWACWRLP